MSDITTELRIWTKATEKSSRMDVRHGGTLCLQAAIEIERLRAERTGSEVGLPLPQQYLDLQNEVERLREFRRRVRSRYVKYAGPFWTWYESTSEKVAEDLRWFESQKAADRKKKKKSNHKCAVEGCQAEDAAETDVILDGVQVKIWLCWGDPIEGSEESDGGHLKRFLGENWNSTGESIRWVRESVTTSGGEST
jgi:hypothetical protein